MTVTTAEISCIQSPSSPWRYLMYWMGTGWVPDGLLRVLDGFEMDNWVTGRGLDEPPIPSPESALFSGPGVLCFDHVGAGVSR